MQFSTFFLTTLLAGLSFTSAANTSSSDYVDFTTHGVPFELRGDYSLSCFSYVFDILFTNNFGTTLCSTNGGTNKENRIFRVDKISATKTKTIGRIAWVKNGKVQCLVKNNSYLKAGACDKKATRFEISKNKDGNVIITGLENTKDCQSIVKGSLNSLLGYCHILERSTWILQRAQGDSLKDLD